MEEIMVKMYKSLDGEIFKTREECFKNDESVHINAIVKRSNHYVNDLCDFYIAGADIMNIRDELCFLSNCDKFVVLNMDEFHLLHSGDYPVENWKEIEDLYYEYHLGNRELNPFPLIIFHSHQRYPHLSFEKCIAVNERNFSKWFQGFDGVSRIETSILNMIMQTYKTDETKSTK